ncbi:leishmanolysin family protein (macronuclear) [Tetrahymena thermophila SB210]|uniref:Leishmanolysin family protein n=1 Tax=Tetrahymena thermophila (strain SB210) TaxID=312017 RepID=Q23LQ9_TETTS|nr:leishmanolysin family protein [Tetrahymena thermophila SB210]EAR97451.2 leishmanolysin family protein [Tetrahymena thermophila SB210]|eukprot:XP_001017696.2 leishmanolysin family protein [Tetrahymena thermophila SB210]
MSSSKKTAILNLLILTFVLVANNSAFAHQEYSCSHDNDDLIKETQRKLHEYFKQNPINYTEDEQGRNLGSQTIQPIRITTDFTRLSAQSNGPAITTDQINYLTSVSKTVVNFVSNFIKVQPNPTNNIFNPQQTSDNTCITVVPSQSDQSTGIPNSDLHLYFIFNSDPTAGYLANAGFCNLQQTSTYFRPNFGRVLFNIANMKNSGTNLEQYQNDVMVTLHEVIHVLGFSYGAMENWYNKATKQLLGQTAANQLITTQTLRGISTKLLGSPNVLATAQKYFGCQTLQGMQLENQGGSGSLNSHWERTIIRSEIMTASALTEGLNLTFFTVALLKDTGYWDDVNENLTDPIYWGRGKGCDFFQNACKSSTQYEEFVASGQLACSFWGDGQGIGSNSDPFDDTCNVVQIYSNFLCSDIANQSYQNDPASFNADTSNDFSYNSKCFASTVISPTPQHTYEDQNFRCHFMQCSPDKTQITITFSQIPSTQIVCGTSDQSTKKDVIYQGKNLGQVTCPSNIARLCDDQQCVNFCTYNGICIRGQCLCNPGFGGVDCSKQCNGYFDQTGNCVSSCPSNTFASTDNVCRTTCPNGTYQDSGSGLCKQCDFSCSQCTGPSNSQCKACQFLTYLSNGSCVTTCPTGQYADETSKTCSNCPDGCSSCTSYTNCTGCKTGYTSSSGACVDSSCTGNCATCSSSSKSSCLSCTSNLYLQPGNTCNSTCPSGYYQNSQNMTCTACSTGCKACSDGKTCTQCDASSGYRQQGNSCTLCASTCATCSSSNPNSCQSCENGLYLFNNQCVVTCQKGYFNGPNYTCSPCVTGCDQCSNGNSCTTCSTGYQPFTYKNQQICINSSSCFSPCSTCSGTFQPTTCATCNQSFYLQGTNCVASCNQGYYANQSNQTCVQCPANCSGCSDASTCTSCSNNYFLSQKSCVQTCPQGQTGNNSQVCISATIKTFAERNYFALMFLILMIFLSF